MIEIVKNFHMKSRKICSQKIAVCSTMQINKNKPNSMYKLHGNGKVYNTHSEREYTQENHKFNFEKYLLNTIEKKRIHMRREKLNVLKILMER